MSCFKIVTLSLTVSLVCSCAHVSLVSVCVYCLSLWQGICDDSECVLCSRACFTKRISHAYNQCDFKYSFSAQYNVNEDSLQWCDY